MYSILPDYCLSQNFSKNNLINPLECGVKKQWPHLWTNKMCWIWIIDLTHAIGVLNIRIIFRTILDFQPRGQRSPTDCSRDSCLEYYVHKSIVSHGKFIPIKVDLTFWNSHIFHDNYHSYHSTERTYHTCHIVACMVWCPSSWMHIFIDWSYRWSINWSIRSTHHYCQTFLAAGVTFRRDVVQIVLLFFKAQ